VQLVRVGGRLHCCGLEPGPAGARCWLTSRSCQERRTASRTSRRCASMVWFHSLGAGTPPYPYPGSIQLRGADDLYTSPPPRDIGHPQPAYRATCSGHRGGPPRGRTG
jgi:hypothetical protein